MQNSVRNLGSQVTWKILFSSFHSSPLLPLFVPIFFPLLKLETLLGTVPRDRYLFCTVGCVPLTGFFLTNCSVCVCRVQDSAFLLVDASREQAVLLLLQHSRGNILTAFFVCIADYDTSRSDLHFHCGSVSKIFVWKTVLFHIVILHR